MAEPEKEQEPMKKAEESSPLLLVPILFTQAELLKQEFGYFFCPAWRTHPLPTDFTASLSFLRVSQKPRYFAGNPFGKVADIGGSAAK